MNYNFIKIPLWREYLYMSTDLKIYDEYNNKIFTLDDLKFKDESGAERLKLKQPGFGLAFNPTIEEFLERYLFGLSATHKIDLQLNLSDVFSSKANGVPLRIPLKYRLENIAKITEAERKVLNALHSRYCKHSFKKLGLSKNTEKGVNWFEITFQAITPVDGRFYCLDFLISSPAGKLALEIDGGYHSTVDQKIWDIERSVLISSKYCTEFERITNEKIFELSEKEIVDLVCKRFLKLVNTFQDSKGFLNEELHKIRTLNKLISLLKPHLRGKYRDFNSESFNSYIRIRRIRNVLDISFCSNKNRMYGNDEEIKKALEGCLREDIYDKVFPVKHIKRLFKL